MISYKDVSPENTTILVVDVQNDFVSEKGFPAIYWKHDVGHLDKITDKLKAFLGKSYLSGVDIIYTQLIYDSEKVPQSIKKNLGEVFGEFAAPNSWGVEFYKINPPKDKVFVKYGFSAFSNNEVEFYLKKNLIKNLIIVGFNSNICVESTARNAIDLGFNIILPKDLIGTSTFMQKHEEEMLKTFELIFGKVVLSEEIVSVWNSKA